MRSSEGQHQATPTIVVALATIATLRRQGCFFSLALRYFRLLLLVVLFFLSECSVWVFFDGLGIFLGCLHVRLTGKLNERPQPNDNVLSKSQNERSQPFEAPLRRRQLRSSLQSSVLKSSRSLFNLSPGRQLSGVSFYSHSIRFLFR